MADTAYSINHAMAQQHWSKELMKEALKRTMMTKFMSKGDNSLIKIKEEMKESGYKVTYGLRMQLAGDGVVGDGILEGSEESLALYTDSLVIDQLRHAVRTEGRASEQRVPFDTRSEAKDALADWWSARIDTTLFNHLAGISTQTNAAYTGNNTITAPSTGRQIFANGETAEANCSDSTNSRFTIGLLDQAIETAKVATPQIQPIRMNGKEYYVCFLHPYQVKDLRTEVSTSRVTWYGVQSAALTANGSASNPIFTGALGEYNGVILHESNYVPASPTVAACRRAIFAGSNAACVAFGKGDGPNRMTWVEELFDYGNKLGVSAGLIWGAKKSVYNSTDYGTIVISTGAA